jgi:hypothetical protein
VIEPTRQQRRQLDRENLLWPETLQQVPRDQWPPSSLPTSRLPAETWRSRGFLVQVFAENDGIERLSVCRTSHNGNSWEDQISWDELQRLKSECRRADKFAVEIFPSDRDVVNVANMRHLWIMPAPLPFGWTRETRA